MAEAEAGAGRKGPAAAETAPLKRTRADIPKSQNSGALKRETLEKQKEYSDARSLLNKLLPEVARVEREAQGARTSSQPIVASDWLKLTSPPTPQNIRYRPSSVTLLV
jgi:hypothetical protein